MTPRYRDEVRQTADAGIPNKAMLQTDGRH